MSVTLEAMVERKGIDVHALRIYWLKSPIFSGVCPYDGSFPVQVESKPGPARNHLVRLFQLDSLQSKTVSRLLMRLHRLDKKSGKKLLLSPEVDSGKLVALRLGSW